MVTKKLNPYKDTKGLAEINQSIVVRMSYVRKEQDGSYTQLHNGVKCRDFLGDALWATQQKFKVSIYGFSFDGKNNPIDLDKIRFVLNFSDTTEEVKNNFLNNLELLHEIERKHKLTLTRVYRVSRSKNKFIVEGSKFWLKSVFNISLYTFLFKAMCYKYNVADWFTALQGMGGTEANYAQQVKNVWKFYMENLKKLNRGTFNVTGRDLTSSHDISQCHNYCGFVSTRFMNSKSFFETRMKKLYEEWKNGN